MTVAPMDRIAQAVSKATGLERVALAAYNKGAHQKTLAT